LNRDNLAIGSRRSADSLLIAAAKRYNRVLQHGIQMRSCPITMRAGQLLRDGIIGEVKVARAWNAEKRPAPPHRPTDRPPVWQQDEFVEIVEYPTIPEPSLFVLAAIGLLSLSIGRQRSH